jgi:hydrogenase maturation protease
MRIIASGNRDRGDDGAGIIVGERLRILGLPVEIQSGEAFALVESWKDAEDVLVIDAVVSDAPPGTVHVWDSCELPKLLVGSQASSHGFGVAEAIQISRILGCLPRRLRIFAIEGRNFEVGAELSPEVSQAIDRMVSRILAVAAPGRKTMEAAADEVSTPVKS